MNQSMIPAGRKFEEDFFGPRDFRRRYVPHLTYHAAINDAKCRQRELRWDPRVPSTPLGNEIFLGVMGNLSFEHQRALRLYVALGTSLDLHWHTDCFFEIERNARVTIDITLRKHKEFNRWMSADFLLTQDKLFYDGAHEIGYEIARRLMRSYRST